MAKPIFNTVSDELIECVSQFVADLRDRGYRVKIEPSEIGFPNTPTLVATRQATTLIIEVDNKPKKARLQAWVRFAKSRPKDTRVAFVTDKQLIGNDEDFLRNESIGLQVLRNGMFIEQIPAADLAVNLSLPDRTSLPRKVKVLLSQAYEQFAGSYWREGFEEACKVLEVEARKYLKKHWRSGRIIVLKPNGQPRALTGRAIDKMTMGQLAKTFEQFQRPNQADSLIGEGLKKINTDRIGVVHTKNKRSTESRLRKNVAQHMWTIVAALKTIK